VLLKLLADVHRSVSLVVGLDVVGLAVSLDVGFVVGLDVGFVVGLDVGFVIGL
jgi:hypothetical protein